MIYFSPIPLGKDVLSLGRSQLLLALIRSMLTFNQLLKPDLGGGALGFNWPRQVTWQRNGNRARFTLGGQWPESNDIHPKRRRITRGRGGGGGAGNNWYWISKQEFCIVRPVHAMGIEQIYLDPLVTSQKCPICSHHQETKKCVIITRSDLFMW